MSGKESMGRMNWSDSQWGEYRAPDAILVQVREDRERKKERGPFSWDVVTKKDLHLVSTMIMRRLSLLHSR